MYFKQIQGREIYDVKLHISDPNPRKEITKTDIFFSFGDAKMHLTTERRKWLLQEFTDFVKHKSVIFRTSGGEYYRVPERLDALTRLENAVQIIPQLENSKFFNSIYNSGGLLRRILPHKSNTSYGESESKIMQMEAVAMDELTEQFGIFKFKSKTEIYY
jgi:hypothetical protein